ncbi:DUF92 domain-containing protein [Mucilaginibacter sp. CAU 1740]|uniref:DUF92 domain-containing protein n=1 Tax=Mucilaginibacter sp. CAU 1740 TaxID=3140365 RepID=UPI00325BF1D6
MWLSYLILAIVLFAGVTYSIAARKLTVIAALTGAAVACAVFAGGGFTGLATMTVFFILGSAATSWQLKTKQIINAEEKSSRTAGQVLANAGTAGICGVLVLLLPQHSVLFQLMMAASLASATADTLSSELGMVYGRRFFNIITFKADVKGLDGVVSIEGTLIGSAGAAVIALIYFIGHCWSVDLLWIVTAGTLGNIIDSVLGAVLERKGIIGNNMVNFLNTFAAALFMLLFYLIF